MVGSRVEVEITGVAHGGIFIARHEGRVLFVSDAIVGERVIAEVTDDAKKSFWRAVTVEVLVPAASRRDHVWAEAAVDRAPELRPGGAEFGHIELAAQRDLKATVIRESMMKMAKIQIDAKVEPLPPGDDDGSGHDDGPGDDDGHDGDDGHGDDDGHDDDRPEPGDDHARKNPPIDLTGTGWRTRTRLQVAPDGTPGPYSSRSHRVIPVSDLPLAVHRARTVAPLNERFVGAEWVDIVVPSVGNAFVTSKHPSGRVHPQRIVERFGEREFALDLHGFWQVHRHAPATLSRAVQVAIDDEMFDDRAANLDLYGGVGLLAAAVADRFGPAVRITTVESDARATDYAAENLTEFAGAVAVTARVDRYLSRLLSLATEAERSRLRAGTVVLDPPRAGAGTEVVDALTVLDPAQIVYVACDPVALARDVALFSDRGWQLRSLHAFDLFPNTHHVEAVASLIRRP